MSVLLSEHLPLLGAAPDGIQKLRGLILELAVRGKLVPQDPNDEPASELLKQIAKERGRLEREGICKKLKATPFVGEDEQPFSLPESWQWVRLGSLSETITSGSRDWAQNYSADGAIFVRMGNLSRGTYRLRLSNIQHVNAPADGEGTRTRLQAGDLLLSITGEVGLLGLIPEGFGEAYINQHTAMIRTISTMRGRFIPEVLRSPLASGQFNAPQRGIKNSYRLSEVADLIIPLPPLAEQHRIVAKVDELMALCDRLEAEQTDAEAAHAKLVETLLGTLTQSTDAAELAVNWQRLAENFATLFTTESSLDALKQTILQLAVMGRLVPQDPNDEPASELLKRIAKERARLVESGINKKTKPTPLVGEDEQPFALPCGWEWIRFSQLDPEFQNGESSRGETSGTEIVVLRLADISKGAISLLDTRSMVLPGSSVKKFRLQKNDLLVIRVNGSAEIVGRLVMCTENMDAIYCDHFIRVRIKDASIAHRFLRLIGDAPAVRGQIQGLFITTAGQKTVNQGHIGGLVIPLPPLAEQHRIVAKVDELTALCDRLKADLAVSRTGQARLSSALIESALQAA